jgi:hypothetical protein
LDKAIAKLFTTMVKEEWLPNEWKEEKLIMIHKKGDKNKCDNYRGISCSSNMSKLFTKIIMTRVQAYVETNKILGEMQNGFRQGRSTTDNLILSTLLEKGRQEGKQMHLNFIDFKKHIIMSPGKHYGKS